MSEKQSINPFEFIYKPDTKVEIEGEFLSQLINFVSKVTEDNTEYTHSHRFKFINRETQKEIKKAKPEDIESGKVVKIVDVEATLNSKPETQLKPRALEALYTSVLLQNVHLKAIEEGKAVHYTKMQKEQESPLTLVP